MNLSNITIGTDIEFAIFENNMPIPANPHLGLDLGIKKKGLFFEKLDTSEWFAERDVVNLEFTHTTTFRLDQNEEFNKDIRDLVDKIDIALGKPFREVKLVSFVEHEDYLLNQEEYKYRERGCDPDTNAWTKTFNTIPEEVKVSNHYGCGFHIHIGYDNPNMETTLKIVKLLDLYVGTVSVELDSDRERRIKSGYGVAGSYREKPYGLEYRVLGTGVLQDPEAINIIFEGIEQALLNVNNTEILNFIQSNMFEIQEGINEYNLDKIKKLWQNYWELSGLQEPAKVQV